MNNNLFVGIPTNDGRAMISSCIELFSLSRVIGKPIQLMIGEAGNIPRARNTVMDEIRKILNKNNGTAWTLWIDSDILLPSNSHHLIANAIQWSGQTGKAWVANYKMANHKNVLIKNRDLYQPIHYTDEELATFAPYSEVGMSGFGLAYLPMDLSYTFHADRWGEDVHFFIDHPDLKIYFAKDILIHHKKTVLL